MKKSEKIVFAAAGFAVLPAGALYWFFPSLPWWIYAVVWAIVFGTAYQAWLRQAAAETIVNSKVLGKDG
jgi:fatty acid desaturase